MVLFYANYMISLDDFKKSLGNLAMELSEEEILKLRDLQDQEAEIYFNLWLEEINKNKVQ